MRRYLTGITRLLPSPSAGESERFERNSGEVTELRSIVEDGLSNLQISVKSTT